MEEIPYESIKVHALRIGWPLSSTIQESKTKEKFKEALLSNEKVRRAVLKADEIRKRYGKEDKPIYIWFYPREGIHDTVDAVKIDFSLCESREDKRIEVEFKKTIEDVKLPFHYACLPLPPWATNDPLECGAALPDSEIMILDDETLPKIRNYVDRLLKDLEGMI